MNPEEMTLRKLLAHENKVILIMTQALYEKLKECEKEKKKKH